VSWLGALRRIRNAIWYWLPETPEELRARFDHELWYYRRYREPDAWTPEDMREDDGGDFPSEGDHFEEWIDRIFARFTRMLHKAAADRQLVVVLDGLSGVYAPDLRSRLAPGLLGPAAAESSVRWIVVGTDAQLGGVREGMADAACATVEVNPFTGDELPRVVREFFAREDVDVSAADWWPGVQRVIEKPPPTPWPMVLLMPFLRHYVEQP
jgi:hypothetical protein